MEILNLEGHQNRTTGSRVTAILLNARIFPIGQSGEASRWRVCYQRGLPRLVYIGDNNNAMHSISHIFDLPEIERRQGHVHFSRLYKDRGEIRQDPLKPWTEFSTDSGCTFHCDVLL